MKIIKLSYAFRFRAVVPDDENGYLIPINDEKVFKQNARKQFIYHQDDVEDKMKTLKEITAEEYAQLEDLEDNIRKQSEAVPMQENNTETSPKQEEVKVLPEGHYLDEYGYEITPIIIDEDAVSNPEEIDDMFINAELEREEKENNEN